MKSLWKYIGILVGSVAVWSFLFTTQPDAAFTTDLHGKTIAQIPSPSPTLPARDSASSRQQVCAIVKAMPDAKDTDQFLTKVRVSREQALVNLDQLKSLMQQIDTDGYGWQNVIGKRDAIPEAQLHPWILGALRMACDS